MWFNMLTFSNFLNQSESESTLQAVGEDVASTATEKATTLWEGLKKLIPDDFLDKVIDFGISIIIALIVWFIGKKIINFILKLLDKSFERSSMEISVSQFLRALVSASLKIILVVIVVGIVGVKSSSLVALVGSAGLTIGLAVQGSLSNFAGGVLILLVKPFKVGDYIIEKSGNNEGVVTAIDIFYTKLLTADNKMIVIPNGTLSNTSIINVTNEPIRRLDLNVSVDYSENIGKVKDILSDLAASNDKILPDYDTTIYVSSFDPSAINIGMRVWVNQEDYWILKWEMLENIKNAFDANNITIPFDQLDVNVTNKNDALSQITQTR